SRMYTARAVLSLPPDIIRMWRKFFFMLRILSREYGVYEPSWSVSGRARRAAAGQLPPGPPPRRPSHPAAHRPSGPEAPAREPVAAVDEGGAGAVGLAPAPRHPVR